MQNRWKDTPHDEIEQLVHQSRLVGMEEDLVLWGGGNNSVKSRAADLLGRPIDVMYIKSSGSDMKSIVPKQFPAVRLDYIAPLRQRDEDMSDQEMVDYLAKCLIDPASARPSIETLLHAFLPAVAVLHTHADAILAITNTRGREETVRAAFDRDAAARGPPRPRRAAHARRRDPGAHEYHRPRRDRARVLRRGRDPRAVPASRVSPEP